MAWVHDAARCWTEFLDRCLFGSFCANTFVLAGDLRQWVRPLGRVEAEASGRSSLEISWYGPKLTMVGYMKLPGGDRAIVDIAKLRDYCLNPAHPRGRHKARVFASTLGLTAADAGFLRENLLRAAREGSATPGDSDEHGERYGVDFRLDRGGRQATVRSAWIISRRGLIPRLTSCFVLLKGGLPWAK